METLEVLPVRIRITSILRKAIYAGEYKSGDELSLTDVAARLGVSRTPVREAFQMLESEGLITLRMNKGAIVNTIDRKFIRDIFEMRILLESQAAFLAAKNGMEEETLNKLLERSFSMQDHPDPLDSGEYVALNQAIHQAVWQAADNHQLTGYLLELWNGPSVGHGEKSGTVPVWATVKRPLSIIIRLQPLSTSIFWNPSGTVRRRKRKKPCFGTLAEAWRICLCTIPRYKRKTRSIVLHVEMIRSGLKFECLL